MGVQWGGTRQRPHISRAAENKNWHGGLFVCEGVVLCHWGWEGEWTLEFYFSSNPLGSHYGRSALKGKNLRSRGTVLFL